MFKQICPKFRFDGLLIPLELIRSNRDAVRKAREAHLIHKGNTLSPLGMTRRDEADEAH